MARTTKRNASKIRRFYCKKLLIKRRIFYESSYTDLTKRDLILAVAFDNIGYTEAVREYEKRNIIVYDRLATSIYSKRMLKSFGLDGVVRISPLHCNSKEEMYEFLLVTKEIANL